MASAGRLFGAALLNALGKGAEGAAKGYEDARNYALKKATAEAELVPEIAKDMAWLQKHPELKEETLEYKRAGRPEVPVVQQPEQVRTADVVADLESIPKERRTVAQQAKLDQLKKVPKKQPGEALKAIIEKAGGQTTTPPPSKSVPVTTDVNYVFVNGKLVPSK